MSAIRPEFLKVSPDDIARVGALGACVLALVRYVTALPGEFNGRLLIDGAMWWRASHENIGESLGGVHRLSVRRALGELQAAGEVLAIPAEAFYGDRAQAYRVPDQPLVENEQCSDQPLFKTEPPIVQKRTSSLFRSEQSSFTGEPRRTLRGEETSSRNSVARPSITVR